KEKTAHAPPAQAKAKWEQARQLYLKAGQAFQQAAETLKGDDRAAEVWHAVECYLQGQEHPQAVTSLKTFVQLPVSPDRLGEAWYRLAESYTALKATDAVENAYLECIKYASPYAYQARLQLAYHDVFYRHYPDTATRDKYWDNAEAMLKQNVMLQGPNAN